LIGYVACPRLQVETAAGSDRALGLAPLAVAAPYRRRGIGADLVRTALTRCAADGERLVFVLGAPDYYGRFGFTLSAAESFRSAYAGPYFMAYGLAANAPRAGQVRYPAAFDGLG
jgi:putative acetyltransferase